MEHNVNWDLNIAIPSSSSIFLDNPKEYVLHRQTQTHFHYIGAVANGTQK